MESATIQYGRLDADELAANTRWWEIYEECFPLAGEREPPFAIIDSVRKEAGTAFRAHEHGRTIAIARTHALADHKDFLAYIGVTASYRRQGVADALFRALPNRDKIFEVEDPEHAALYDTTPDACQTRIRWYQTHFGAILLDAPYLQPPLVEGVDPLPFRLMWTGEKLGSIRVSQLIFG